MKSLRAVKIGMYKDKILKQEINSNYIHFQFCLKQITKKLKITFGENEV
jgi:hypothetical protein